MTITAQSNFSIPPPHVAQSTLNHVCRSIVSVLVNTAWSQYLGTFLLSEVAINLFWDLVLYYLLMAVSSECAQPLLMDDRGAEVGSSQHLSESTNMELSRYSVARQEDSWLGGADDKPNIKWWLWTLETLALPVSEPGWRRCASINFSQNVINLHNDRGIA